MRSARAQACANVALAKYWGKRDAVLNLPYTGSVSITLEGLTTMAQIGPGGDRGSDEIVLNGEPASAHEARRVAAFLDLIRAEAHAPTPARVEVSTNFPVAAGIASSASTFAALTLAATTAYGLQVDPARMSALARRGSGSAARSIFGGYVEWLAGETTDGSDSYAVPLAAADYWRLGIVIAITHVGPKPVGSREGMELAARRSPFFPAWLESHDDDLERIRLGILERNLALVGETAEHNCLKMHAASLASRPALLYWKPATVAVIERVYALRRSGVEAYFTIDAGPQVKVLCAFEQCKQVAQALQEVPGVQRVLLSEPGPAAQLLEN